jgi:hypothetical protein
MINKNNLLQTIFILCCILICIWTIPETIFWRNLILIFGGLFSLYFLFKKTCTQTIYSSFAIKILGLLLIWVLVHFLFFSMDPKIQSKELSSLWLRSLLAMFIATSVVIYLKKFPESFLTFGFCIGFTVLTNIGIYLFHSINAGQFLLLGGAMGKPFYKIETVFWGSLWIAYAIANLQYLLFDAKLNIKFKYIFLWISAILLTLISAMLSSAKNGMITGAALIFIFIVMLIVKSKIKFANFKLSIICLILILSILIFGYWSWRASPNWTSLFTDIHIASQIEQYHHWKNPEKNGYPPNVVANNVYERVAWASAGFWIITDHPLGYGLVNQSFERWLDYLGIDHQTNRQTHMGWIDFGLAFGFPGVLILWSAIFFIIYKGFRQKNKLSLIAGWTCMAIFGLGLISEIFYKQFFEAVMFWITFGAVAVSGTEKT